MGKLGAHLHIFRTKRGYLIIHIMQKPTDKNRLLYNRDISSPQAVLVQSNKSHFFFIIIIISQFLLSKNVTFLCNICLSLFFFLLEKEVES